MIDAPVGDVWEVVSNPRTHPDWWPEVVRIDAPEQVAEGDEYLHTSKMVRFVDAVDSIWVVERLAELREAQFRCTMTGTWARFTLTPAQDNTFVQMEAGIDPASWRWRIAEPFLALQYKRWLIAVLDALPDAINARVGASAAAPAE
jgi:hypothetical protein